MASETVPPALDKLMTRWRADGGQAQAGMTWPRERWIERLSGHQAVLEALPDVLDREAVRRACSDAAMDATRAEVAFVAVMAWGYGGVGYGPYRTWMILTAPDAGHRLAEAARRLRDNGAMAAYDCLADGGDCRLTGLGPAFGTKYLYFLPRRAEPSALILDSLAAAWLKRETDLDVNPVGWSGQTYRTYLEQMHRWAASLGCAPDELESNVFQAMKNERGGQGVQGIR